MIPSDPVAWSVGQFKESSLAAQYRTYAAYAEGNQELRYVSRNMAQALRGIFDALTYNRCAPVVDAIADRLHLIGFTDPSGASVDPANDLWAENRMDKREGEVNLETLTSGDGYAIVWPSLNTGRPTIWPEDAANVRVRYDDEEPGLVVLAAKYWLDADGSGRLNLYLPDRLEKYVTITPAKSGIPTAAGFTRFQAETDTEWPIRYSWYRPGVVNVPVFHFGNNARTGRYGRSELRDVIPLQDGLNVTLAKLMAASDDAATPRIVITGWSPKSNEVTGRTVDPFERPVRPFETVNERRAAFPDAATNVEQLPMIDLAQLIALGEAFDLMIARTARIPVHYLGLSGNFPSGESLKTAEAPFVRKVIDRQTAFGNVWEDAMGLALRQTGMPATFQLDAVYEPAEARSDREQAELAALYAQTGMPLASILRIALGLDADEVAKVLNDAAALVPALARHLDTGQLQDREELSA